MTTAGPSLRYLCRGDVIRAADGLDVAAVIRDALRHHGSGLTTLPDEAYLGWTASDGSAARSLALPGAVWGDRPAVGLKIINSSLGNTRRGIQRAQGITCVFDPETAHPVAILEAAYLSALRTAAYTLLSVQLLAPPGASRVGVVGAGALGLAHARLLAAELPDAGFAVYDLDDARAEAAALTLSQEGIACSTSTSWQQAVDGADIVVTATTTTTGYIDHASLAPGALVAHVSLDDVLPDVVTLADVVVVDDWSLVSGDERRLLGRMIHSGDLLGPGDPESSTATTPRPRRIDATMAQVVLGTHPGRRSPDDIILSNPFGMGILDVALAAEILDRARDLGLGIVLPV